MSKKFKFVNPGNPPTVQAASVQQTDWRECVLCQSQTSENLQCPAESKRKDVGIGYKTLANNLESFATLKSIPLNLNLARLDDGNGIELTLYNHKAMWHKSCAMLFKTTMLARAAKREHSPEETSKPENVSKTYTRTMSGLSKPEKDKDVCYFCGECDSTQLGILYNAATHRIYDRVYKCAKDLQDSPLLAKLSSGDLVAQEAKYHLRCLVELYNRHRSLLNQQASCTNVNSGIVLAELLEYMDDARSCAEVAPVFKLSELCKLYTTRLEHLGTDVSGGIKSTTLKERILAMSPDLQAHKEGRNILLAFDKDIGLALRHACKEDSDDEAMILVKAAKIIRRDMFKMTSSFEGSFKDKCQENAIPNSLLAFVRMVLDGPNIMSQSKSPQASLSIAQLIVFNSYVRRRAEAVGHHHNRKRETPLPLYIGLYLHAKTRKRKLIDEMFRLGLSISYDRVTEIGTGLANGVSEQFRVDNVVCPPKLRRDVFTTAAVDNLDHNPSSSTSRESFHGTGISLFQHPTKAQPGVKRHINIQLDDYNCKRVIPLPESYANVTPVFIRNMQPNVPYVNVSFQTDCANIQPALEEETQWLDRVYETCINTTDGEDPINVSWAAYHASKQTPNDYPVSITSLMPLYNESSHSVAMIKHALDMIKLAVNHLNPGQVPVVTMDQPLYAIAKAVNWTFPETHGEDKFVILQAGLHTEMAWLRLLGDLLEESGWTVAITEADLTSAGMADSFLKASHVKRARYAHEVTACSLNILIKKAYTTFCEHVESEQEVPSFEDWCSVRCVQSPHFQFWKIILDLQLLLFVFIKSLRRGDYKLYIDSLQKVVPWFFALDHTHYARWTSVEIRNLLALPKTCASVYEQFISGNFVVRKTQRQFSSIAIDQAHEQNNALVKDEGGAVDLLTNSPAAMCRYMVGGPEIARVCEEFQHILEVTNSKTPTAHHEQTPSFQNTFQKHVRSLVSTIEHMGNPFLEESGDLLVLDTKVIVDPLVSASVSKLIPLGERQYQTFVTERLQKDSKRSIYDPIKKNKLALFSSPPARIKKASQLQIQNLKTNYTLFSNLYVALQSRQGNPDEFFKHENQPFPPSLSKHSELRPGTKADLLHCLETLTNICTDSPSHDMIILDGAVIVNMLSPSTVKTFDDYSKHVVIPYIKRKLMDSKRLDVVWDKYLENSLKSTTRKKRGVKGTRRRVEASVSVPTNWQSFLRLDENKTSLFDFLAKSIGDVYVAGKQIITTYHQDVICNPPLEDASGLSPCNHEESDSRMFVHAADGARQGFRRIIIRSVDTDVVVLAVASVQHLDADELWIAVGVGKDQRFIAAHEIAKTLGPQKSTALPVFHAFTGCDTVSFFNGKGKKTAWTTWKCYDAVTAAFVAIASAPDSIAEECFSILERFTVLMYDRGSMLDRVDQARKQLFMQKHRNIDDLPPTQAALLQHTKRAAYQGGHIWGHTLILSPHLPSPSEWGWIQADSGVWDPLWTTLPEAMTSCKELLRCISCRGKCKPAKDGTERCTCAIAGLNCTDLCSCKGECSREK